MNGRVDRREFLEQLGLASALVAGSSATARGFFANETLGVGCIGTGGRCQQLMRALAEVPGTRITAVCDIWDKHLDAGKQLAAPGAFTTKDHHELLARKDVDAVIIGTPDHHHVPITIDACQAGKDVYVEKPLTHDLSEGAAVIAAQNAHRRVVQVGTQQRSMPQFLKALEIVKSGELGPLHKVHLTWNRNTPRWARQSYGIDPKTVDWKRFLGQAPPQDFDEYRFRNWRWFWDFGGGIFTDLMVHQIDIAQWFLNVDHPQSAASLGSFFSARDVWQTPDTVQTLLEYPDAKAQVYFEGTFANARNGAMLEFMGSEATLYLDRGRYEIHPERNKKIAKSELVLGSGPRGADFYDLPKGEVLHLANWVEAIRSRVPPRCPAEVGVSSAAAAHLANASLRNGQVARWTG
ncbi:MAG TPA: Gfo/Idh/MocA family oxidoreductase [Pirellulales bacterium]|jgi:predicted dehydrogenase|nr:Gfo/Idh/MocA family oxidoreductase [Pirellulales bacterium]